VLSFLIHIYRYIFIYTSGFKGAVGMTGIDGGIYILALCDGNHCSERKRNDAGNGKIVLMRKRKRTTNVFPVPTSSPTTITPKILEDYTDNTILSFSHREDKLLPQVQDLIDHERDHYDECIWETMKILDVPKTAYFRDYSDMDITNDGKIIISTQQESAVWVGRLKGIDEGLLDPNIVHFDKDEKGVILSFPKTDSCYTKYCNIEGVKVLNERMIMAVSGMMQGHGLQDFRYVLLFVWILRMSLHIYI